MSIARLATPLFAKIALVAGGVLLLAIAVLSWQLSGARGTIETQRNAIADCNAARRVQNAAIDRMRREGEQREIDQRQRLEEARRQNSAQEARITTLRRGAVTPRAPGPCVISEALRGAAGL